MKSLNAIAKEIGVSPQAVYKKVSTGLLNQLNIEFKLVRGGIRLNDAGVEAVKALFVSTVEQPVEQPLNNEIEYLRSQNEMLLRQNHELALKIAEITQANQVLIGMEKQGIINRIFSRFKK